MRLTKKTEDGYVMMHKSIGSQAVLDMHQERMEIQTMIDKLGLLEDVEEELDIDLITLFKAFRYGIYVKMHKYNGYVSPQDLRGTLGWEYILDFANKEDHSHPYEVKLIFGKTGICLTSKSYGKTWALTKEELE